MKTVVEKVFEALDRSVFSSASEPLKSELMEFKSEAIGLNLEEVRNAWIDGYRKGKSGLDHYSDDFLKEKYPESFCNVKEKE